MFILILASLSFIIFLFFMIFVVTLLILDGTFFTSPQLALSPQYCAPRAVDAHTRTLVAVRRLGRGCLARSPGPRRAAPRVLQGSLGATYAAEAWWLVWSSDDVTASQARAQVLVSLPMMMPSTAVIVHGTAMCGGDWAAAADCAAGASAATALLIHRRPGPTPLKNIHKH